MGGRRCRLRWGVETEATTVPHSTLCAPVHFRLCWIVYQEFVCWRYSKAEQKEIQESEAEKDLLQGRARRKGSLACSKGSDSLMSFGEEFLWPVFRGRAAGYVILDWLVVR